MVYSVCCSQGKERERERLCQSDIAFVWMILCKLWIRVAITICYLLKSLNVSFCNDVFCFQVFNMETSFLTVTLVTVGALTIFFFFLDIIWSLLQFFRALLAPLFLPNEDGSLLKKYGSWACKYTRLYYVIFYCK